MDRTTLSVKKRTKSKSIGSSYCCVINCSNHAKKVDPRTGQRVKMHKFPNSIKERDRCLKWIHNLRRADLNLNNVRAKLVCSVHFKQSIYNCPSDIANSRLLPGAVPELVDCPNTPKPKQKPQKKPRKPVRSEDSASVEPENSTEIDPLSEPDNATEIEPSSEPNFSTEIEIEPSSVPAHSTEIQPSSEHDNSTVIDLTSEPDNSTEIEIEPSSEPNNSTEIEIDPLSEPCAEIKSKDTDGRLKEALQQIEKLKKENNRLKRKLLNYKERHTFFYTELKIQGASQK